MFHTSRTDENLHSEEDGEGVKLKIRSVSDMNTFLISKFAWIENF